MATWSDYTTKEQDELVEKLSEHGIADILQTVAQGAYAEGHLQGVEEGSEVAYDAEYDRGYQDGLIEGEQNARNR